MYLFSYYFWLHWVFDAACRLSLVVASGGYSLDVVRGFSLQCLLLWSTGPRAPGLQQLGHMGLTAPRLVGSSQRRD